MVLGTFGFLPSGIFYILFYLGGSVLNGYYWGIKKENAFWYGFVISIAFGPIIAVIIGYCINRVDFGFYIGENIGLHSGKDGSNKVLPELISAVQSGSLTVVENLIAIGVDVNARGGINHKTALMEAVRLRKGLRICTCLINAGADVNAQDKMGKTALMWAVEGDTDLEIIKLIIKSGADVNVQDKKGMTALMHAAYNNPNDQVVVELLKAGANPQMVDKEGKSLISYAYKKPNEVFLNSDVFDKLRRTIFVKHG